MRIEDITIGCNFLSAAAFWYCKRDNLSAVFERNIPDWLESVVDIVAFSKLVQIIRAAEDEGIIIGFVGVDILIC